MFSEAGTSVVKMERLPPPDLPQTHQLNQQHGCAAAGISVNKYRNVRFCMSPPVLT